MRTANRFTRGTGCYTCRSCKRKTRDTGRGDNEGVLLCAECYDLAGIENAVQDGEPLEKYAGEARRLLAEIRAKGGKPDFMFEERL